MATVLRVKRKHTDKSTDMLMITCKRLKTESPSLEESVPAAQTIVQFAGTLKNQTEDVVKHMVKVLPKMDTIDIKQSSRDLPTISEKVRKWIGLNAIERYKVINCQRSVSINTSDNIKFQDIRMTLIDVEDSWSVPCKTKQDQVEEVTEYAYDLYYAQTFDDVRLDDIRIQQVEYPILDTEHEDRSSDSNLESNSSINIDDIADDIENARQAYFLTLLRRVNERESSEDKICFSSSTSEQTRSNFYIRRHVRQMYTFYSF